MQGIAHPAREYGDQSIQGGGGQFGVSLDKEATITVEPALRIQAAIAVIAEPFAHDQVVDAAVIDKRVRLQLQYAEGKTGQRLPRRIPDNARVYDFDVAVAIISAQDGLQECRVGFFSRGAGAISG